MSTATTAKPFFVWLTDEEFTERYGDFPTSALKPLFGNEVMTIYLDSGANVIYYVTPS
ncbi:hypothetical protein [Micromonospora sp. DT62]|uniref:hypothetical protein n=1 Tax=Micromonospora sp. DT62 TaxID=3416521 RepID=UPI003CF57FDA